MRIAITADPFIPVPPLNYGGIERIICLLAEGLKALGHDVIVVAHKDSIVDADLIKYPSISTNFIGTLKNLSAINELKKWKPDLIHSFSRIAYLLPFLKSEIPKLMSYQRRPTISQIKKAMIFAKKGTLTFTGCSNYISNQFSDHAPTYTVYNGVDLSKYQFTRVVKEDAPMVFLGRIEPIKGTHNAIKAAQFTGKKLIIAGNIPKEYKNYYDQEIRPHLNNQISYIGEVNDKQKNELLGSAALLLMPIEWDEPFGIVMAEALACGTPIIGYPNGAVSEVIKPNVNGYLAKNFEELCSYINQYHRLSRKAVRKTVEENFSSQKIITDYLKIYNQLVFKNS